MPAAKTNFDKLTDGNYHEWKIYMEALLTRKDQLDYVDGTKRHPGGTEGSKKVKDFYRKQSEARAEIVLRVTPSQLAHCRDPDPMTIWNNLITIHSSRGRSTIIALRRCFHRLRLEHTETMSAYVARVRHIAFLLEEADVTVADDDIILAITSGLPRSYDSFLISLDATPDDDYTLTYVITRLVNEYQRQHAHQNPHRDQPASASDNAAFVANSTPRRDLSFITCFGCGQKGHYQINCPTNSSTSTPSTTTDKSSRTDHASIADENPDADLVW
jgi:hypothetical protein